MDDRVSVPGAEQHPSLALVNTVTTQTGGAPLDELDTPEELRKWLLRRALIAPEAELQEHCRSRIVALRESLRIIFDAHAQGDVPAADAVDELNRALTAVPGALLLRFEPTSGFTRSPDHPTTQVIEHVMALIADDAASLLSGHEASMLAQCDASPCSRFFLRTHARRQWCSTRCGDRVRAARSYVRKKAPSVRE
ncbi:MULTISPECIES: ABATE domain-containing protein [unclassified Microbacterium]|uniref:CGNR zinc finger domain-containing protein n=1 Tax=unclassified Microbacterium TaxID=2609290 RepID=UPI000EA9EACF|nr:MULTISPECIES: CGNR zinc finger domain-containing protein [unclassified Microbacterium]MBT2485290.1 ABATE domain-containing protein [Microbacterium sp. ISL-108]RKN68104.1 hypothetical protein D7252_11265 [Microbacterium sp. CGR2]